MHRLELQQQLNNLFAVSGVASRHQARKHHADGERHRENWGLGRG